MVDRAQQAGFPVDANATPGKDACTTIFTTTTHDPFDETLRVRELDISYAYNLQHVTDIGRYCEAVACEVFVRPKLARQAGVSCGLILPGKDCPTLL